MSEIFYNKPLDIEIKSFTEVNGFIFPLRINIADIKYNSVSVEFVKVNMGSEPNDDELIYGIKQSPYRNQYDINKYFDELEFIYLFIDWDLTDENFITFRELIGISDSKEFVKWFMNCHIFNVESILDISREIRYYVDYVKVDFINRLTELFDLDKKEPKITFKESSTPVPDGYGEFLSYNYNMTSFQTAFEFPTTIWFKENMGKAYTDFSWREQEAKRMYITAKTKIENFRETYKSKQLEEIRN